MINSVTDLIYQNDQNISKLNSIKDIIEKFDKTKFPSHIQYGLLVDNLKQILDIENE